jgi:hypothetical protein
MLAPAAPPPHSSTPAKPMQSSNVIVKGRGYDPNEPEYTEEDLEGFVPTSSDASYFEKAQDFRHIIKILRIKYLGLRAVQKTDSEGNILTTYQKDRKRFTGINEEGVEANVRFLETRLGKHTVLTSWSEERMFKVILDDMLSWRDMMIQNFERYNMTETAMIELRILLNDLLEYAYRRPIDNKEREDMRPIGKEIMRRLGLDRDEEQQMQQQSYPTGIVDKLRRESQEQY